MWVRKKIYLFLDILIIVSTAFATALFFWANSFCFGLSPEGRPEFPFWIVSPVNLLVRNIFICGLLFFAFWFAFSVTVKKITKKDLASILHEDAKTFLPLLLLILPLLQFSHFLNRFTNFFIYIAQDLNWFLLIFTILGIILLKVNYLSKFRTEGRPKIKVLPDRWIKITIFVTAIIIFLILKQNFIPFGAEGEERFKLFTGDEPHYCLIAHSLVFDKDFDLKNNLEKQDYRRFYPQRMTAHGFRFWTASAERDYSYHRLGLPILIAPAYYLGTKLGWGERQLVVVLLNLLAAMLAVNIYTLCYEKTKDRLVSIFITPLACFTIPIIIYAHQVYPELLGSLLIIYAYRNIMNMNPIVPLTPTLWELKSQCNNLSWLKTLLIGSCIAYLPWLHERFIPITIVLFAYFIFKIRFNKKMTTIILIPLIISAVLQMAYYWKLYGLPIPIQEGWVKGTYDAQFGFINKEGAYIGLLGLFLDRAEGLLIYTPVFAFSLVGILLLFRENLQEGLWFLVIFSSYYIPVGIFGSWWGGGAPPPRFMVAIVPMLALPLAVSLKQIKSNKFKCPFILLSIISIGLGLFLIHHPEKMYLYGKYHQHQFAFSNLTSVMDLTRYFPSLYEKTKVTFILVCIWLAIILIVSLNFLYRARESTNRTLKSWFYFAAVVFAVIFLIIQVGDVLAGSAGKLMVNDYNPLTRSFIEKMNKLTEEKVSFINKSNIPIQKQIPYLFYEAEDLPKRIGANEEDKDASGGFSRYGNVAENEKGNLLFGPYESLPAGNYLVSFRLKTDNIKQEKDIAKLDIAANSGRIILKEESIKGTNFGAPGKYQEFSIQFKLPERTENLEFRIEFLKKANFWIDWVKVYPLFNLERS